MPWLQWSKDRNAYRELRLGAFHFLVRHLRSQLMYTIANALFAVQERTAITPKAPPIMRAVQDRPTVVELREQRRYASSNKQNSRCTKGR